jgi:hypothetical protein
MRWRTFHDRQQCRPLDEWHLDRSAMAEDRDLRRLDHAAHLCRDGLTSAIGLDVQDPDAMGLGW